MGTIKCCKLCPDRYVGCHAECERYIQEHEQITKERELYKKDMPINNRVDYAAKVKKPRPLVKRSHRR